MSTKLSAGRCPLDLHVALFEAHFIAVFLRCPTNTRVLAYFRVDSGQAVLGFSGSVVEKIGRGFGIRYGGIP